MSSIAILSSVATLCLVTVLYVCLGCTVTGRNTSRRTQCSSRSGTTLTTLCTSRRNLLAEQEQQNQDEQQQTHNNRVHDYVSHAQTGHRNSQRVTAKHTVLTLDAQLATIDGELYTGTRQIIVEGVHLLLVQRGEGRRLESEFVRNTVVVTQLLSELNIRLQSVVTAEGVVATGAGDGHL